VQQNLEIVPGLMHCLAVYDVPLGDKAATRSVLGIIGTLGTVWMLW